MKPTEPKMTASRQITVSLAAEMVRTIDESVAAGEYASSNDLVGEALRLWQRQKMSDAAYLAELEARVRRSIDDPRPSFTDEQVRDRLAALHEETVKAQGHEAA
jgi:antitoxin ParD1/3/4